jgi:hypothetical protein
MKMKIDRCPICEGELQATEEREVYFSRVTLIVGDEGLDGDLESEHLWEECGDETLNRRFYCENDHDSQEMFCALRASQVG